LGKIIEKVSGMSYEKYLQVNMRLKANLPAVPTIRTIGNVPCPKLPS